MESAPGAVCRDREGPQPARCEELDPAAAAHPDRPVLFHAPAEAEGVPCAGGVEIEPPVGGHGADQPPGRSRALGCAAQRAVYGPGGLRAGPVLQVGVGPPGVPPVERDACESKPLVRWARERLEHGALSRQRVVRCDEPQSRAGFAEETGLRRQARQPREVRETGTGQHLAGVARIDWPLDDGKSGCGLARDPGVGGLHERFKPRESPRPALRLHTRAKRCAVRTARSRFARAASSGSYCSRLGTRAAPSGGGPRRDAARGRGWRRRRTARVRRRRAIRTRGGTRRAIRAGTGLASSSRAVGHRVALRRHAATPAAPSRGHARRPPSRASR